MKAVMMAQHHAMGHLIKTAHVLLTLLWMLELLDDRQSVLVCVAERMSDL
jgi:hypothetical protein